MDKATQRLPLDRAEDLDVNEPAVPAVPRTARIQPRWLGKEPDVRVPPPRKLYSGWQAPTVVGHTGMGGDAPSTGQLVAGKVQVHLPSEAETAPPTAEGADTDGARQPVAPAMDADLTADDAKGKPTRKKDA
jgi:hypothetical protein